MTTGFANWTTTGCSSVRMCPTPVPSSTAADDPIRLASVWGDMFGVSLTSGRFVSIVVMVRRAAAPRGRTGSVVREFGPPRRYRSARMVNLVTGFTPKTAGTVLSEGTDITRLPPHEIARRAVARTFQIVQPFAEMTELENVLAGGLFAGRRATLTDASQAPVRCLEFVGLDRFARDPASQLSLANPQRLELAKSLAMQPRLLFLDEVNAGLNPPRSMVRWS